MRMKNRLSIILILALMFVCLSQTIAFAVPADTLNEIGSVVEEIAAENVGHMVTSEDGISALATDIVNQTMQAIQETMNTVSDTVTGGSDSSLVDARDALSGATDLISKIEVTKKNYAFTVMNPDSAKKKLLDMGDALNSLSNGFFSAAKSWLLIVAKAVYSILDFSVFQKVNEDVISFINEFSGGDNIFNYSESTGFSALVWLGVAFSLCLVVLMFAQRRTAGALGKLIQVALIMALISGYIQLPTMFMAGAEAFSQALGQRIITTSSDSDTDTKDAIVEKIWLMGVDHPWQITEFGSVQIEEGMLKADQSSEAFDWFITYQDYRVDSIASAAARAGQDLHQYQQMFGTQYDGTEDTVARYEIGDLKVLTKNDRGIQSDRLGEAFLILIIDIILGAILFFISAMGIGFQIGAIVMWVIGFFVLILALFPTHGTAKIKEWAGLIAMSYFGQIVIYVIILFTLNLTEWLYTASGGEYKMLFLMLIGVAMAIKFFGGSIVRLFTSGGIADPGSRIANMGRRATAGAGLGMAVAYRLGRRGAREANRQGKRTVSGIRKIKSGLDNRRGGKSNVDSKGAWVNSGDGSIKSSSSIKQYDNPIGPEPSGSWVNTSEGSSKLEDVEPTPAKQYDSPIGPPTSRKMDINPTRQHNEPIGPKPAGTWVSSKDGSVRLGDVKPTPTKQYDKPIGPEPPIKNTSRGSDNPPGGGGAGVYVRSSTGEVKKTSSTKPDVSTPPTEMRRRSNASPMSGKKKG